MPIGFSAIASAIDILAAQKQASPLNQTNLATAFDVSACNSDCSHSAPKLTPVGQLRASEQLSPEFQKALLDAQEAAQQANQSPGKDSDAQKGLANGADQIGGVAVSTGQALSISA